MNSNHEAKANRILDLFDMSDGLLKSADSFLKDHGETEKQNIGSALDQIKSEWASYEVQTDLFPADIWQSAKTDLTELPQSENNLSTNVKRFCEKVTEIVCDGLINEIHNSVYISKQLAKRILNIYIYIYIRKVVRKKSFSWCLRAV